MEEVVPLRSAVLSDAPHPAAHVAEAKAARKGGQRFKFQQRTAKLDLRKIASVSVEHIIHHVDITTLQDLLENITFADITADEIRCMSEPILAKMFKIIQLVVEYLLHVQSTLAAGLTELALKYQQKKRLVEDKQRIVNDLQRSQRELHDEVRQQRRTIATLEHMLRVAARKRAQLVVAAERTIEPAAKDLQTEFSESKTGGQDRECVQGNMNDEQAQRLQLEIVTPEGSILSIPMLPFQTVQELVYATAAQIGLENALHLRILRKEVQLPHHVRLADYGIVSGERLTTIIKAPQQATETATPTPAEHNVRAIDTIDLVQQTLQQNTAMVDGAVRLIARLYDERQPPPRHQSSETALLYDEIRLLQTQLDLQKQALHERAHDSRHESQSQSQTPGQTNSVHTRAGDIEDDHDDDDVAHTALVAAPRKQLFRRQRTHAPTSNNKQTQLTLVPSVDMIVGEQQAQDDKLSVVSKPASVSVRYGPSLKSAETRFDEFVMLAVRVTDRTVKHVKIPRTATLKEVTEDIASSLGVISKRIRINLRTGAHAANANELKKLVEASLASVELLEGPLVSDHTVEQIRRHYLAENLSEKQVKVTDPQTGVGAQDPQQNEEQRSLDKAGRELRKQLETIESLPDMPPESLKRHINVLRDSLDELPERLRASAEEVVEDLVPPAETSDGSSHVASSELSASTQNSVLAEEASSGSSSQSATNQPERQVERYLLHESGSEHSSEGELLSRAENHVDLPNQQPGASIVTINATRLTTTLQKTFDSTLTSTGVGTVTSSMLDATADTDISVPDSAGVAKRADEYERSAATGVVTNNTPSAAKETKSERRKQHITEVLTEPVEDTSLVFSESSSTLPLLNDSFASTSEEKRG